VVPELRILSYRKRNPVKTYCQNYWQFWSALSVVGNEMPEKSEDFSTKKTGQSW